MSSEAFRKIVWTHFKKYGRKDLPWRHTLSPYHIMVSEFMLQQTQVERVIPFYWRFIETFPTVERLAAASSADVLRLWQGLGYNRRAIKLQKAAQEIGGHYRGKFPRSIEILETLPGFGPYTARAVAAFAFRTDSVFVETNIRTAITHHFFADKKNVPDEKIKEVLRAVLPKGKSRDWYSALMDYGAYLKRSGVRINSKSKHYAKQSRFAGSTREARGVILKDLSKGPRGKQRLIGLLGDDRAPQVASALSALIKEGFIKKSGRTFALSS